ncbi:MAG TPA: FG-GAP-like repeat-containing protein [Acidimicrobiales bacterium]|nr:FG-GAP-like repeat-containing protein [Acidimicrobiales bacterium]
MGRPDHAATGDFAFSTFSVDGTFRTTVGDFDDDGRDDIIWYRPFDGDDYTWWGESDRTFSRLEIRHGGDFTLVAGDYDGDGAHDILSYRPG